MEEAEEDETLLCTGKQKTLPVIEKCLNAGAACTIF
jgi:hypothetical protein